LNNSKAGKEIKRKLLDIIAFYYKILPVAEKKAHPRLLGEKGKI